MATIKKLASIPVCATGGCHSIWACWHANLYLTLPYVSTCPRMTDLAGCKSAETLKETLKETIWFLLNQKLIS